MFLSMEFHECKLRQKRREPRRCGTKDGWILAEAFDPDDIRFPAEPSQLPFGVLPGFDGDALDGLRRRHPAFDASQGFLVSQRFKRLCCAGHACGQQSADFVKKASGPHGPGALGDSFVEGLSGWRKDKFQYPVSLQRRTAPFEKLRGRLSGRKADLDGPGEFVCVVLVYPLS